MDARFIRAPFRRLLVSRPRHHAFGLLIPDVIVLLQIAKLSGVPLVFLRGERGEDSPLLHLSVEGVSIVDNGVVGSPALSRAWTILLRWFRFKDLLLSPPRLHVINAGLFVVDAGLGALAALLLLRLRRPWNTVVQAVQTRLVNLPTHKLSRWTRWGRAVSDALDRWKIPKRDRDADVRERVLTLRGQLLAWLDERRRNIPVRREAHHGYDIRRLCVEHPLQVSLRPSDEATARQLAADLGLVDRPLVALHVRDGGSKRDAEGGGFARDVSRDARIESYLPAVDFLVSRGYTVVRIGDPGMRPCQHPGLVDLATHPRHSLMLDLWCVKNCRFFIAGDSGPYTLSWLFNVPCLGVNITNILGLFPLRPSDRYLIKTVQEVATGREIPLSELLTTSGLMTLRRRIAKEGALRYVDNDEDDILAAVQEMERGLQNSVPESVLQAQYRQRILAIRQDPRFQGKLNKKTDGGEVLLGEGRVADAFVTRHFGPAADRAEPV